MNFTKIEAWLSGDQDYQQGCALHSNLSNNAFLKAIFAQGPTTFNRSKLRQELERILAEKPVEVKSKVITDQEYAELPEEGKAIQKEWKSWYAEMNSLRHQLTNHMTENARHELALKILYLDSNIREAWKKIDYWRKYGEFPKIADDIENLKALPVLDLVKRKNNLATYISKFSNDTSKLEKIEAWKKEQLQIQSILDGVI